MKPYLIALAGSCGWRSRGSDPTSRLSNLICILAFSAQCFVPINGFPVVEDGAPTIIGSERVCVTTQPGKRMTLQCEAQTNRDDVTLIYWLVNDAFPEDAANSERIVELEETTAQEGVVLKRGLLLKKVTQEDFRSNFTCVVTNAVGAAHKVVQIKRSCSSKRRKKGRHHSV